MDQPVVANVMGTIGAVCWSVQLIPQIIINYRRHNATGLQPTMMMFWAWAGVPLGVYNIVKDFNIALQIQPQMLAFLSLTTWIQVYYYEEKWSVPRSLAVVVPIAITMAGIEVGLVFALRHGIAEETTWPLTLMAVLAALFLALGVLRHYWDVWVHRTVRGISFIFCGIDALGDLTSLISVFFQPSFDVLGVVIHGVELTLWCGIFACGGYFNLLPWLRQRCSPQPGAALEDGSEISQEPGQGTAASNEIVLHNLSSSTSVFRTSSASINTARSRARPLGQRVL